jgi:hypothetical protein
MNQTNVDDVSKPNDKTAELLAAVLAAIKENTVVLKQVLEAVKRI